MCFLLVSVAFAVGLLVGYVFCWLTKSNVIKLLQTELDTLKRKL